MNNLHLFVGIFADTDDNFSNIHNQIRVKFVEEWFLKCSFLCKIQTLKDMLRQFRSNVSVELIMYVVETFPEKIFTYMTCDNLPKRTQDRHLTDHNRCLDEEALKIVQEEHLSWFSELSDIAQISIYLDLMRIGGSSVLIQLHEELPNFCKKYRKIPNANSAEETEYDKLQAIINGKNTSFDKKLIKDFDPNNAYSKEVEKLKQNLDHSLQSYAISIDKQSKKLLGATKTKKGTVKGKKGKGKKGKDSSKKKKNKKPKGKKGKKDKEEMDRLQVLPVWIVKKIFNYLDAKTLKKIKNVNSYWAYIVMEIAEEKKAMKFINKHIKKSEIILQKLEGNLTEYTKTITTQKEIDNLTQSERRVKKLLARGALDSNLKPDFLAYEQNKDYSNDLQFPQLLMHSDDIKCAPSCIIDEAYYDSLMSAKNNIKCPSIKNVILSKENLSSDVKNDEK